MNEEVNYVSSILKPVYIKERKELHIPFEFLSELSEEDMKNYARSIKDLEYTKLLFACRFSKNELQFYDYPILKYLPKVNITTLMFDTYVNQNVLDGFDNIEMISLNLSDEICIDLSKFLKIKEISVSGYNGKNLLLGTNKLDICFFGNKKKIFNFDLPKGNYGFLSFRGFTTINLSYIKNEFCGLDIYGAKAIKCLNNINLKKIKQMIIEKSDITFLKSEELYSMKKLEKLLIINCKNVPDFDFDKLKIKEFKII